MTTHPDRNELPPRVRRNYTQGANGQWRAEFTVESYADPQTTEGVRAIRDEDDRVCAEVLATLAILNHRGGEDKD